MKSIACDIKKKVDSFVQKNNRRPDYLVLGWDVAYEVRRFGDIYQSTLTKEYLFGIRILETNVTGILAMGIKIEENEKDSY